MKKADLIREFKELQEAYDSVWHMKERYKALWVKADSKLADLSIWLNEYEHSIPGEDVE